MKHRDKTRRFFFASLRYVLSVGLVCFSLTVWAQDDLERAREQFRLGNDAYVDGNYQQAIEYFEEANRIAPTPRLLLYIGQAYGAMGELEIALDYLEQFAATSDDARRVAQDVIDLLYGPTGGHSVIERAMQIVGAATGITHEGSPGPSIQVNSTPSGADVYIDDLALGSVGQTPLQTVTFAGDHVIIVVLPYHEPVRKKITVDRSQFSPISVEVELIRRTATVDITFEPVGALVTHISEDGVATFLGTGSYEGDLPAGEAVFLIHLRGEERRIEHPLTGEEAVESFTLSLH